MHMYIYMYTHTHICVRGYLGLTLHTPSKICIQTHQVLPHNEDLYCPHLEFRVNPIYISIDLSIYLYTCTYIDIYTNAPGSPTQ